jgi:hypothetical protein
MALTCTSINAANTVLYTSSGNTAITTLIVSNVNPYTASTPTIGQSNLNLFIVPGGGTPNFSNLIVSALPLPAGETFTFDNEKIIMSNGDTLVATSSAATGIAANAVSLTITSYSAKSGTGPYLVTFNIPTTASLGTNGGVGAYFSIVGNGNALYNGVYVCTASTTTTIQLSYTSDPGVYGAGTTTLNISSLVATVSTLSV